MWDGRGVSSALLHTRRAGSPCWSQMADKLFVSTLVCELPITITLFIIVDSSSSREDTRSPSGNRTVWCSPEQPTVSRGVRWFRFSPGLHYKDIAAMPTSRRDDIVSERVLSSVSAPRI